MAEAGDRDRVLAVPNFSLVLPEPGDERLGDGMSGGVRRHYARGDVDHGRSVLAFSGAPEAVVAELLSLARRFLPRIDLGAHRGVHPRIGALDVAPFASLGGDAVGAAERFARAFAAEFDVPTLAYEASGGGARLPDLRRAGARGHPRWGTTVVGARGFLIAANLDFPAALRTEVANAAREIRRRRDAGDPALDGVRALAFDLRSRDQAQLSLNLTRPDVTAFDAVAAIGEALVGALADGTELIGVIRRSDLPGATRLPIDPAQIVD